MTGFIRQPEPKSGSMSPELVIFPVNFPVSREFRSGDRFDTDCIRHHAFARNWRSIPRLVWKCSPLAGFFDRFESLCGQMDQSQALRLPHRKDAPPHLLLIPHSGMRQAVEPRLDWKHGLYSAEAIAYRRQAAAALRWVRRLGAALGGNEGQVCSEKANTRDCSNSVLLASHQVGDDTVITPGQYGVVAARSKSATWFGRAARAIAMEALPIRLFFQCGP